MTDGGGGLTNQIFSLINGIIAAYKQGYKCVVVDGLCDDVFKRPQTYSRISNIFNINAINEFLKKKYDIIIVDKYNVNFKLLSVTYGQNSTYIDLTENIINKFYQYNKLYISKNTCFNDINGDPCFGVPKKIIFKYEINDNYVEEVFNESLNEDFIIDFDINARFWFAWIHHLDINMFESILPNIIYADSFIDKSKMAIENIVSQSVSKKINCIHLRIEDDIVKSLSNICKLTHAEIKILLEYKYMYLIQKYLSPSDDIVILAASISNRVIGFLDNNNYKYRFVDKYYEDREKNAIIDLLISKCCNNYFIGAFNVNLLTGSTFSYYAGKCMPDNVTQIYYDPNDICKPEIVIDKT